VIIFYPRVPATAVITQIALGMALAGALGNALHGAVIDFIHYQIPGVISNVSNIADHAIVGGVLILFVQSWRPDEERQADTPKTGDETTSGSV
jgi:lipoprotein signal peptidase